jgi:DeoR/GlpR family transcriptional regulator of sugar metabolism
MIRVRNNVVEVVERRAEIIRLLVERGQVSVADLSTRLSVSEMTTRRDLEFLEHEGLARRIHGGAVTTVSRSFETPYAARAYDNQAAKRAIGQRVAELIMPGETVIVDAGTTTVEVARALRDRANLLVCPLGLQAATELADRPGIRVLVPGGELRQGEQMFVGEVTRGALAALRFDTYVMAVGGVSRADGFTDFSLDDVAVKQAALRSARRCVVACDSSKLGKVSFARIGALDVAATIVTDAAASAAGRTWLTEAGLDVVIA